MRMMLENQRVNLILQYVSDHFGISIYQMKAGTKKREVVAARHCAMYLIKTFTAFSLKSTGQMFGGRDHTTVMHAIKAIAGEDSYAGNIKDVRFLEKELSEELGQRNVVKVPVSNAAFTYGANQDLNGRYEMSIV